jgi:hypothetical protein
MVARDVADAVAARLDRVHLDLGEFGEDVRHASEVRPVELHVLTRREMAVASVVLARDVRELSQLARRQKAVGHRNPQHRCMLLDIKPVAQPQWAKLVLGELARQEAASLIPELVDSLRNEGMVESVVAIHDHRGSEGKGRPYRWGFMKGRKHF